MNDTFITSSSAGYGHSHVPELLPTACIKRSSTLCQSLYPSPLQHTNHHYLDQMCMLQQQSPPSCSQHWMDLLLREHVFPSFAATIPLTTFEVETPLTQAWGMLVKSRLVLGETAQWTFMVSLIFVGASVKAHLLLPQLHHWCKWMNWWTVLCPIIEIWRILYHTFTWSHSFGGNALSWSTQTVTGHFSITYFQTVP